MNRTEVLQGPRELKFEEIHDRFRLDRVSCAEVAEWFGVRNGRCNFDPNPPPYLRLEYPSCSSDGALGSKEQ